MKTFPEFWSDITANPHWVDVNDKLPEKGEEVLLWSDRYGRCLGTFVDENKYGTIWEFHGEPMLTFNAPTHWMKLPNKPFNNSKCPVCGGVGEHKFNCDLNKKA